MSAMSPAADDTQHLRLLAIFHYVVGGLTGLLACFPLIHVAIGLAMIYAPQSLSSKSGDAPPAFVGWLFVGMGGGLVLAGWAVAVCILLGGRFIARRRRYWFVFVMGCIQCAIFPFGTALGVFTIIVLSRASVKSLFHVTPAMTDGKS